MSLPLYPTTLISSVITPANSDSQEIWKGDIIKDTNYLEFNIFIVIVGLTMVSNKFFRLGVKIIEQLINAIEYVVVICILSLIAYFVSNLAYIKSSRAAFE